MENQRHPKKIMLVKVILEGLVKVIKSIRCKMVCCCKTECGKITPPNTPTNKIIKSTDL